jgi:catechol 2,3-dioxygenase-like lactoylglutathione lyase family enzyme
MPRIESISAVTLVTRDMARSVRFYEALGFPLAYGGPTADFTSFHVGEGHLNLMGGTIATRAFWGRIIFHVDDVDALHARAVALGLEPEAEPRDATWGERYFHLDDPDGHALSFARPLAPSAQRPAPPS